MSKHLTETKYGTIKEKNMVTNSKKTTNSRDNDVHCGVMMLKNIQEKYYIHMLEREKERKNEREESD